ncbi:MAG: LuxR C-terminal-related transcriptional regulator [Bacteroidaceae bacterium]|nr:LuxR C-terminal-related transcriptional regulator [Bacteroidaceae bacterium]
MKLEFAIVDANTLSVMGLKHLLENIMPMTEISVFSSFEALVIAQPERFIHFFVASGIYFEHAQFFIKQPHRSIVLVHGEAYPHIAGLLTLNVCQDEKSLVKSLIQLQQRGREARKNNPVPEMRPTEMPTTPLSAREAEVAVLLAKGHINKEVAEMLNISLTTAISHRKNIMEKLKAHSLADIIVHVVMSGLISIEDL